MFTKKLIILLTPFFIYSSCEKPKPARHDAILSCAVAFAYKGDELASYFTGPAKAYVSGYFMFEDDLADDIIFGLDIEWLELMIQFILKGLTGWHWRVSAGKVFFGFPSDHLKT
jgi:hypothetical protein